MYLHCFYSVWKISKNILFSNRYILNPMFRLKKLQNSLTRNVKIPIECTRNKNKINLFHILLKIFSLNSMWNKFSNLCVKILRYRNRCSYMYMSVILSAVKVLGVQEPTRKFKEYKIDFFMFSHKSILLVYMCLCSKYTWASKRFCY